MKKQYIIRNLINDRYYVFDNRAWGLGADRAKRFDSISSAEAAISGLVGIFVIFTVYDNIQAWKS